MNLSYSEFSGFAVVLFYKVAVNPELGNMMLVASVIKHCSLGEIQG